jgi:thiol-disulfide isomerase/thioredoxin
VGVLIVVSLAVTLVSLQLPVAQRSQVPQQVATTSTTADRASMLSSAISAIMSEPRSVERDTRLEAVVAELDTLPGEFDLKFSHHSSLAFYYHDIALRDAGTIKHATWLINAMKTCDQATRQLYARRMVQHYINLAEALAGQDMTEKAIGVLRQAPKDLPEVTDIEKRVAPTLARYLLIGTMAPPIAAPVWLNMPVGMKDVPMTGVVTLLEFSAHWCGPCKESYPALNRLRAKYASQGFRVVLATSLYGYFGRDPNRNLAADVEIAYDRTYFAEEHMDVPIAIADRTPAAVRGPDGSYSNQEPNQSHYHVLGIPEVVLVDRHGTIRLIMVGYDDANEAQLTKIIDALVNEK